MGFHRGFLCIIGRFIKYKTHFQRFLYFVVPVLVGICILILCRYVDVIPTCGFTFYNFGNGLTNLLMICTSFYITFGIILLVTGGNSEKGILRVQSENMVTNCHRSSFKVIITDIAYQIIVAITFMCILTLIKFLIPISIVKYIKIYIAIMLAFKAHLSFVLLGTIKNIYYLIT